MMFGELTLRENISTNPITITNSSTVELGQSTTIDGSPGVLLQDYVARTWVETHNADLIAYAEIIQLNNTPYGNGVVSFLNPAFANSSISTTLVDALTFPTYYHSLTEANGYITIVNGSTTVNGVGTNFTSLDIITANTHVILDNIPGDNELKMFQVTNIANNTVLTIDTAYSEPSITSGRMLYYTV
jgi:hypothetical protein